MKWLITLSLLTLIYATYMGDDDRRYGRPTIDLFDGHWHCRAAIALHSKIHTCALGGW
jgi:hypothetical protein